MKAQAQGQRQGLLVQRREGPANASSRSAARRLCKQSLQLRTLISISLLLVLCLNVNYWNDYDSLQAREGEMRAGLPAARGLGWDESVSNDQNNTTVYSSNDTESTKEHVFGACLMFRDDLSMLPEWLAYHYTVLPLRYLVLGVDVDNRQDATPVLRAFEQRLDGLHTQVLQVADLVVLDNEKTQSPASGDRTDKQAANTLGNQTRNTAQDTARMHHHAFVDRQKLFVQACNRILYEKGVHWTAHVDSDEFITFNHPRVDKGGIGPTTVPTVVESLATWQVRGMVKGPCYTLPRLRYGALENVTCHPSGTIKASPFVSPWETGLTTRRFVQHARPGDFAANKFGKVIMNLQQLPVDLVLPKNKRDVKIRNIHRPYKQHCGPAAVTTDALLRANHYVGSLSRFTGRSQDGRRTEEAWHLYAHHNFDHSCDDATMQTWVTRFIRAVGDVGAARSLLFPAKAVT
jgi:hypothetical protein